MVIHHACQSRNLEEMTAVAQRAEEYLAAEGDIAALRAKHEAWLAHIQQVMNNIRALLPDAPQ